VQAYKAEQAKKLPEYDRHRHDIDTALTEARQLGLGTP
jgi:hypothetical protein